MDEAHLVGVHEAGVAHHVAAVGEVDGEHRAAAVRDGAGAVLVERGIVVRADVAAGEDLLDVPVERRVDRHHVFEAAVDGAFLDHQDLAIALDDLRFDLARLISVKDFEGSFAVEDLLADFGHATRAQGIGLARPAQRRLDLFHDFRSGLSDHFGTNPGFWWIWFSLSKTNQAPPAAYVRAFSAYLIGLCIPCCSPSE